MPQVNFCVTHAPLNAFFYRLKAGERACTTGSNPWAPLQDETAQITQQLGQIHGEARACCAIDHAVIEGEG